MLKPINCFDGEYNFLSNFYNHSIKTKDDIYMITLCENKWRLYLLSTGKKIIESKDFFVVRNKVEN